LKTSTQPHALTATTTSTGRLFVREITPRTA
jgi:hypothetical protein